LDETPVVKRFTTDDFEAGKLPFVITKNKLTLHCSDYFDKNVLKGKKRT
jgi:hypothetical protein